VRYDSSAVRTLEAAVGRPAEAHSWVLTDTSTGTVKGIYASETLALASLTKLVHRDPGGKVYVMTVLHPAECDCPEVA
jgi:hypothetical protein